MKLSDDFDFSWVDTKGGKWKLLGILLAGFLFALLVRLVS